MSTTAVEQFLMYPIKTIKEIVARAYPNWKIIGISERSKNGLTWEVPEWASEQFPDPAWSLRDMQKFAEEGYTKVALKLAHTNGVGDARPDYFIEEFAVPFQWKPRDPLEVFANQGTRDAVVLAVIGNEALIEYEMPKGSTAMWIIHAGYPDVRKLRNVSYKACSKKWKEAMDAECIEWIGNGQ